MSLQKKITGVALFLLAAWGIWYVTTLAITPKENGVYLKVGQNQEKSDVYFELDSIEGNDVAIPYILVDGKRVYPFGNDRYISERGHVMSYDKLFLYMGKGVDAYGAVFEGYVFDITHNVNHEIVDTKGNMLRFASEDRVLVWWERDGRMFIEYEDPDTGTAKRYVSVSKTTPWIVEGWK